MLKGIQSILILSFILSLSLFGGKNVALTKEIENMREGVVYSIRRAASEEFTEEAAEAVLAYTEGFWVEDDETAYILKTYDNAVFEVKKKSRREILLSATALPTSIVTDTENLYVFDEILHELQIYTKQGELLLRQKVELKDDYVKDLVKKEGEIAIHTHKGKLIPLDCKTGKLEFSEAVQLPTPDTAGYNCVEYIGTDEDGTVYSVHTKLVNKCSVIAGELTLRAVTAEGKLIGSYILPTQEYRYLPGKYVHVMENGNIYLLIPAENAVEVRKIALKDKAESNFTAISKNALAIETDYASEVRYKKQEGTACTEKINISREEARQRADAIAGYRWTLKKTHTLTSKSEKGVTLPREVTYYKAQNADKSSWSVELQGIPYCWGGFYALDIGVGKLTFPQVLKEKYVTGNIETKGYYKYMTAGLDCSGYVCAVFKFKTKTNTGGLACLGSSVTNVKKLQQMDILVWPGEHVIFFLEWLDNATMLVSESNVRNGKVITHPKTINELVVGVEYQMRTPFTAK